MTNESTKRWAWITVVALAMTAWGSALIGDSDVSVSVLCIGVIFTLISLLVLYRAVQNDPELNEEDRERISRWLKFFGPAGAVQLLLYIHFPRSKFGGH